MRVFWSFLSINLQQNGSNSGKEKIYLKLKTCASKEKHYILVEVLIYSDQTCNLWIRGRFPSLLYLYKLFDTINFLQLFIILKHININMSNEKNAPNALHPYTHPYMHPYMHSYILHQKCTHIFCSC